MSLYDRIIAEDSRRKPSRDRPWGTGPMSRQDTMSPKLRKLAAKALRKANVHPTNSDPETRHKILDKDPAFQSHRVGQEIRTMTRSSRPPSPGARSRGGASTKPGYKMVFGKWRKAKTK